MRSALCLGITIWTAALVRGPAAAAAAAQESPATNTPATDTVGPRELQDFSLSGTAARPADEPAAQAPPAEPAAARTAQAPQRERAPRPAAAQTHAAQSTAPTPAPAAAPVQAAQTSPLPTMPASIRQQAAPAEAAPGPVSDADSREASLAPDHHLLIWPWILAAIALGAGAAFLLWRNRTHRPA